MNDKMNMDIRLKIVEEIYEGDADAADRIRAERPELSDELEAMQTMKSALDARPARRPDATTLDAVMKAAADVSAGREPESRQPGGRRDRPPRARRALYLRSAGVATAVLAVLIAVTTVWQADLLDGSLPTDAERVVAGQRIEEYASTAEPADLAETQPESSAALEKQASSPLDLSASAARPFNRAVAVERSESLDDEMQNANMGVRGDALTTTFMIAGREARRRPSDILPVGMRPTEFAAYAEEEGGFRVGDEPANEDIAWDQASAVMEMYQQIEMIGEGVARGWEPPSVPLEMVPASRQGGSSNVRPALEKRIP